MKNTGHFTRIISLLLSVVFVFSLCTFTTSAADGGETPAQKYANHAPINLWGDVVPYNGVGANTNVVPKIYPYIAEDNPTGMCAVIFPGGGYSALSTEKEGSNIAKFLNDQGISAFVVHYRHSDGGKRGYDYRAILSDGLRGVKFARYNAEEFGIDPDKIFTIGFSAGGHLTCMTATHFDFEVDDPNYTPDEIDAVSARPNAAAPSYAVATICESYTHGGTRDYFSRGDKQIQKDFSAENSVTENTPPIFLWHTWDDTTVPIQNCLGFAAALADANIPCELHIYGRGTHGLGLGNGEYGTSKNPTAYNWSTLLVDWLGRTLVTE